MTDSRNGQSRRMKTVRDVSAGGVAFRSGPDGIEVALVGRLEPERWALPKGTPKRGESMEQAAMREVTEETGLHVRLIRPLLDIDYWFVLHGVRHFKTVHFYLMEAIGGDVSLHDAEYDVVKWFPLAEASHHLSYPNERDVLAQAEAELTEGLGTSALRGARNKCASRGQEQVRFAGSGDAGLPSLTPDP